MPLILITGMSTSGKSTIANELIKRGYVAYDTEHNGISAWYNKKTGKKAAEFGEMPERTAEWLSRHEWRISMDWVAKIAEEANVKTIFLCGGAANEEAVRELCQNVFWLQTDEATIRDRIARPRDHDYGTNPHELKVILEGNQKKETVYRNSGAVIIDATKSVDEVVEAILTVVQITD